MSSPDSDTDHDLGLFKADAPGAAHRGVGLYHIAWEIGSLDELVQAKERLTAMGALVGENNHGVSRSLYCQDPDGIEFEIMWEVPIELLDDDAPSNVPLDLDADIARWGGRTRKPRRLNPVVLDFDQQRANEDARAGVDPTIAEPVHPGSANDRGSLP